MTQGSDPGLQVPQVPQVLQVPQEYIVPVGQINSKLSNVSTNSPYPLPKPNPALSNKGLVIVQAICSKKFKNKHLKKIK